MSKEYENHYMPYFLCIDSTRLQQVPDNNMGDRAHEIWGYKKVQTPEEQPYKNLSQENKER